jgi:hypothetical protein
MAKHKDSAAARANHIVPMNDIRPKAVSAFLESTPIPEAQKSILQNSQTHVWKRAAKQAGHDAEYTTPLSPDAPIKHYDLRKAAMFILKVGSDKVSEMGSKIQQSRKEKTAKAAYDPLNVFSDRRTR